MRGPGLAIWKPRARSPPPPPTVPAPCRLNWVTGRHLHAGTVLGSRESSTLVDAALAKIPPVLLDSRASPRRQPESSAHFGKAHDGEEHRPQVLREYRHGYPKASEAEIQMLAGAEQKHGSPPHSLEHAKNILGIAADKQG